MHPNLGPIMAYKWGICGIFSTNYCLSSVPARQIYETCAPMLAVVGGRWFTLPD